MLVIARKWGAPFLALLLASVAVLAIFGVAAAAAEEDDPDAAEIIIEEEVIVASILVELPKDKSHEDQEEQCAEWAEAGECDANPDFMHANCAKSCGISRGIKQGKAYVYSGEDATIGAFRFAEIYSSQYTPNIPAGAVLDVARELQQHMEEEGQRYTVPKDLTHCSSGEKKRRPCSAGKLWKRAEEMRKEDMHDSAGADLIRALLKSGIEVDFREKCERSLNWAFGSIRRQRERERREAEEEAKLEKRRAEEREAKADFVKFGTQLQEKLASGSFASSVGEAAVDADGSVDAERFEEVSALIGAAVQSFVATGPHGGNWSETLQLLKKISPSDKTVDILLIEARGVRHHDVSPPPCTVETEHAKINRTRKNQQNTQQSTVRCTALGCKSRLRWRWSLARWRGGSTVMKRRRQ